MTDGFDEEKYEAFYHSGLLCKIVKHRTRWCGYVSISKNHKLYGMNYFQRHEDESILKKPFLKKLKLLKSLDVDGGLTYSEGFFPRENRNGLWIFGFDCRGDRGYIVSETKRLAEQLSMM